MIIIVNDIKCLDVEHGGWRRGLLMIPIQAFCLNRSFRSYHLYGCASIG